MRGAGRLRAWVTRGREARKKRRYERSLAGPKLIREFATAYPNAFFVEIGANDGIKHDHLRPHVLTNSWRGVMVEPVPYLFKRLKANYDGVDRVAFENAAIASQDGELPFYYVVDAEPGERDALPEWYDGIGSFSRETVLAHAKNIPDIGARIIEMPVRTLTFDSLCRLHGADDVDLLAVDTEGYDAEILRGIDFAARRPRLLIYEHFHLSPDDRARCRSMLSKAGYETLEEGFDTFCLVPGEGDALDGLWKKLKPGIPGLYVEDEE